jgi:hypothetical protein
MIDRAIRRGRRARALAAGGGVLSLGEAVNLVVEQQDLAIEVTAQHMHRMVAADRERIAIAGDDPHVQLRVGELHPGRDRGRAAVDGVEAIALDIIRKARGAADARDEHGVLRACADLGMVRCTAFRIA